MTAPTPGDVLGTRFRLVERCAAGGKERWRAVELSTDERVELTWGPDGQPLSGDLQAAAASLRVQHPVLASSRGLFRHSGVWVAVHEAPLQTQLGTGRGVPAPEDEVLKLGGQLAGALCALHGEGLVHGDVHPAAVSLHHRRVRLSGLRGALWEPPLRAGQTAPEVVSGAAGSCAADMYGLGVVLHTYALGTLPYGDDGWRAVARQRTEERPALPLSDALCDLIGALLDPNPGLRPSAEEVRHALRRLQASFPVAPRGSMWPSFRPRRTHAVVGHDPEQGRDVLVRSGCSRGQARRLARALGDAGWVARSERVALGGRDVLGAVFVGALGHAVFPLVGFVAGAGWWLYQRSWSLRAREVTLLPALARPVPRVHGHSRRSGLAAAGVALMVAGPALLIVPWLSALLVALAALLVHSEQGGPARHPASDLRVELALEDLERIADGLVDTEASLGLLGEVQALRSEWQAGSGNAALVLHGAERLSRRHRTATGAGSSRRTSSGEVLGPHC